MKTADLDYDLPESLIAQHPAPVREGSRLLVLDRAEKTISEEAFSNIGAHLHPNDCLVVNDTRVIRARLKGQKPTGGAVEIFLLREVEPCLWEALVRPSAKVKPGTPVRIGEAFQATVEDATPEGKRLVRFPVEDVIGALEKAGEVPLPPYIRRTSAEAADTERYQTVYAQRPGAIAAPTAGLHFSDDLLTQLETQGVRRTSLTLHVGYGTFKPVQAEILEEHRVEPEEFLLSKDCAAQLNETRDQGGRVVAVGTTTTRVLESQYRDGKYIPGEGITDLAIFPGHHFQAVDALLTNFHLPRSSLLALVCAFGSTDLVLEAYRHAVREKFRFYSYGDAMLIV